MSLKGFMKWVCRGTIYQRWDTEESKDLEVTKNLILIKSFCDSSKLKIEKFIYSQDDKIVYKYINIHKYDCISAISELEATKRFFGHSCLQSRMQGTKKNKARKGHRA